MCIKHILCYLWYAVYIGVGAGFMVVLGYQSGILQKNYPFLRIHNVNTIGRREHKINLTVMMYVDLLYVDYTWWKFITAILLYYILNSWLQTHVSVKLHNYINKSKDISGCLFLSIRLGLVAKHIVLAYTILPTIFTNSCSVFNKRNVNLICLIECSFNFT